MIGPPKSMRGTKLSVSESSVPIAKTASAPAKYSRASLRTVVALRLSG